MGILIKNHWARLIVLTAASYHFAASMLSFFWPKILWDFATKNLDGAVKPIPILQILNLISSLLVLAWEWPVSIIASSCLHRSIEMRIAGLPMCATLAVLLYEGTNAALYYMLGTLLYCWAYCDAEVICAEPWTLPKRKQGMEV